MPSFESWENKLFEMFYGPDCHCEEHCDESGDHEECESCCQCRDPEPYFDDNYDPSDYR